MPHAMQWTATREAHFAVRYSTDHNILWVTQHRWRIVALAHQALGDADDAREWLNAGHPLLGSTRPIEVAATDLGARPVRAAPASPRPSPLPGMEREKPSKPA